MVALGQCFLYGFMKGHYFSHVTVLILTQRSVPKSSLLLAVAVRLFTKESGLAARQQALTGIKVECSNVYA